MAFIRPTLKALITRTTADLASRLELQGALLRRSPTRKLAMVWAGLVHSLHGHLDYLSRQFLTSTAEAEELDKHGSEYSMTRKAAVFAAGSVTFTGVNASVIPAGTPLQRSDGVEYKTGAEVVIAAGTATATVTAAVAGVDGNADTGVVLNLVSALAGVNSAATVAAPGITNGADTESDDDYRARILARKRNPPQGGAIADYEKWALEVASVTRVWIYPGHMGIWTVGVTFVLDDDPASIIPNAAKVTEVQTYLDDDTRKPVTAEVIVFAPVAVPLNPQIQLTPNTAAVQAAVTAQLKDLLKREGRPGPSTLLHSHIREAISIAAGEENHVLVSPAADIAYATGQIPTLGAITWL